MPGNNINSKIFACAARFAGQEVSRGDIINWILKEYPGTNASSLIPSDYCYNIVNKGSGIRLDSRVFEYVERDGKWLYKCLGKNYAYNGDIAWKQKGSGRPERKIVGKWTDGKPVIFEEYKEMLGLD